MSRVLVVHPDAPLGARVRDLCRMAGHHCYAVRTVEEAAELLRWGRVELAFIDGRFDAAARSWLRHDRSPRPALALRFVEIHDGERDADDVVIGCPRDPRVVATLTTPVTDESFDEALTRAMLVLTALLPERELPAAKFPPESNSASRSKAHMSAVHRAPELPPLQSPEPPPDGCEGRIEKYLYWARDGLENRIRNRCLAAGMRFSHVQWEPSPHAGLAAVLRHSAPELPLFSNHAAPPRETAPPPGLSSTRSVAVWQVVMAHLSHLALGLGDETRTAVQLGKVRSQVAHGGQGTHPFLGLATGSIAVVGRGLECAALAGCAGWWWPLEDGCVIATDGPVEMSLDEDGRLHAWEGPCLQYADGFCVFAWHGIRIPRRYARDPRHLTLKDLDRERNAELRRLLRERYGEDRFFTDNIADLIDVDSVPIDAAVAGGRMITRALVTQQDGSRWLVASDGSTNRVYHMRVPTACTTCTEAYEALSGRRGVRTIMEA